MNRFDRLSAMLGRVPTKVLELEARVPVTRQLTALFSQAIASVRPDVIAEVGAFDARFARRMAALYPAARVVAFEANPEVGATYAAACAADGVDYRSVAVGAATGRAMLRVPTRVRGRQMPAINRMASLNALAVPDSDADAVDVAMTTLDDALAGLAGGVALLIDVEGAVGAVLDGAAGTLQRAAVVRCDLASVARYEGQALADDVVARLGALGLVAVARDCARPDQFGALFLREPVAQRLEPALAAFEARCTLVAARAGRVGATAAAAVPVTGQAGAAAPAKPAADAPAPLADVSALLDALRLSQKLNVDPSLLALIQHAIDPLRPRATILDHLVAAHANGRRRTALDFGCGEAAWKENIEAVGFVWTGVDLHDSTDFANERCGDVAIDRYDGAILPYADASFDVVFSCQSFEHVLDPYLSMSECVRVLKPAGVFTGSVSFLEPYHAYQTFSYTPYGFMKVAARCGLELKQVAPQEDGLFWLLRKVGRISAVDAAAALSRTDLLVRLFGDAFARLPVKQQTSLELQFCATFNFRMEKAAA